MLQNIWPFGLAMYSGDISESINCCFFLKHGHNEHSNRGGGGKGDEVDKVSERKRSAIHREASVQTQCITSLGTRLNIKVVPVRIF